MPKVGFWSIGGYAISFRKDGRWYADDEVIANPKIARLFSSHVRPSGDGDDGEWVIDIGIDRQTVTVEDTPLVVVSVDGDLERGLTVTTNDGVCEALDLASLESGDDNVLYCTVDRGERGRMRARFLRPAYYAMASWMEDRDDGPVIAYGGRCYPVAAAPRARV